MCKETHNNHIKKLKMQFGGAALFSGEMEYQSTENGKDVSYKDAVLFIDYNSEYNDYTLNLYISYNDYQDDKASVIITTGGKHIDLTYEDKVLTIDNSLDSIEIVFSNITSIN